MIFKRGPVRSSFIEYLVNDDMMDFFILILFAPLCLMSLFIVYSTKRYSEVLKSFLLKKRIYRYRRFP